MTNDSLSDIERLKKMIQNDVNQSEIGNTHQNPANPANSAFSERFNYSSLNFQKLENLLSNSEKNERNSEQSSGLLEEHKALDSRSNPSSEDIRFKSQISQFVQMREPKSENGHNDTTNILNPNSASNNDTHIDTNISTIPHIPLELSFSSCADPYSKEVKRLKILFPIPPDTPIDSNHFVYPDASNQNIPLSGLRDTSQVALQSQDRRGSVQGETRRKNSLKVDQSIHNRAGSFSISSSYDKQQQHHIRMHSVPANQKTIPQIVNSTKSRSSLPNSQRDVMNALPLVMQKFPELLRTVEVLRPLSGNNSFSSLKRINIDKVSRTERPDAIKRSHLLTLIHSWLKHKKLDRVAEVLQREVGITLPNEANDDLKRLLQFAMDEEDDDLLKIPKQAREERMRAEDNEVQTSEIYGYDIEKEIAEQVETHIWDEGEDKPQINVIFGSDDKSIHAATLNKLVERITDSAVNNDYRNTFMETYRSFTSPETILRKLFERYNVPTHVNQQTKNIVKTRVTQLLKLWIKDYFFDWNEGMLRSLEKFMDDHLQKEYPRFISSLQANCDRLRRGEVQKMVIINSTSVERPLITIDQLLQTDNINFYAINVEEIARQITVVEHQIYRKIRSPELLNQAWNNKTLRHRSPNVLRLIERFNRISEWVSSEVVRPESLAKRIERYEYFIRLAQLFRENLHNFNTMLAVCSGLQSAAVNRLRHTKRGVDENLANSLQEMLRIMSTDDSYKEFRNVLKSAPPPKLPYLGMFLTDITFIEDGNPDFIESKEVPGKMLINWSKRVMLYRVIKQIRDYQGYDYAQYYASIHQIQNLIEKCINTDVIRGDELFELSTKREAKKAKLSQLVP